MIGSARMRLAAWAALLLVTACAQPMTGGASFPAEYVPGSSPPVAPGVPGCATFANLSLVDARADRSVVGERFKEGETKRWSIWMRGDPVPMLQQAADRAMRAAAMLPNPAAPHDMRLALVSVFMEEKQAFNSTYRAVVVLETTVLSRDGAIVWTARHTGEGKNYGMPGSPINYQETVSRALNAALPTALGDSALHQALCQPPGAPNPAPTQPSSPPPGAGQGTTGVPPAVQTSGPKVSIETAINVPEEPSRTLAEVFADALAACQVVAPSGTRFLLTLSVTDAAEVQGLDAAPAQCVGQRITDRVRGLVQQGTYFRTNGSKVGTIRARLVE